MSKQFVQIIHHRLITFTNSETHGEVTLNLLENGMITHQCGQLMEKTMPNKSIERLMMMALCGWKREKFMKHLKIST